MRAFVPARPTAALTVLLLLSSALTPAFADTLVLPPAPAGLGHADSAPAPAGIPAYVDTGASNQRGDACLSTLETNAGVRLLSGFLEIWTPRTPFVDADQDAPAKDGCAAVTKSDWDGLPRSATDGTMKNPAVHAANLAYVIRTTAANTPEDDLEAYLDDRRGKSVSITDGLGPLADAWRKGVQQTTTVTDMPADATSVKYDDKGNNRGVGSKDGNAAMGKAVDLVEAGSKDGSTEPAKRYYKYARPYRWSEEVRVVPQLEPAKSTKPAGDGGFPSGHTAEAWRDALVMAYLVPQRYQEMVTRAVRMGENRIRAGMHQPFDVIGGRMQATAVVAYNLNRADYAGLKAEAYQQTQSFLATDTGAAGFDGLMALAHSAPAGTDPFADRSANAAFVAPRFSYGLPKISAGDAAAVVPKGAEVLLETRLPYLDAAQRRLVLKSTALPAGYPIMSDAEGWGRLNLFAAADGFAAFDGDVTVTMDAAKGGFNAADSWKNDIAGVGRLVKTGSGSLTLSGNNSFSGGVIVEDGTLVAKSSRAFGTGDLYVSGGRVVVADAHPAVSGNLVLRRAGGLDVALSGKDGGITVAKSVAVEGGTLRVSLAAGYTPSVGDELSLIRSDSFNGTFEAIVLEGHDTVPVYGKTGLSLRITK
ncbi:autotransporter-associated beta strand protein [Neorhizobium galegae]|uniref:acid phosphatase n=1 Tax=Neorhizobium galegae TaxID=399 RepID=UPI001AE3072A|nr:phosphatase PAP2 family protein [Neorhizobium galegae]MBP2549503.1 autotransporter-associated beta strand protein [Neorhizobium galegae]